MIARGIADQEIQLDLLREKNQDMTLNDMIEYIEAKASGKRSAPRLLAPTRPSMHGYNQQFVSVRETTGCTQHGKSQAG